MKTSAKRLVLGAGLVLMGGAGMFPGVSPKLGFVRDAGAIAGVAPGGSVVRRRAVVTTAAVASTSASAAAAASKPPPPQAAPPAGPPPPGTIVATLPPGCAPTMLNGVEYQRCGSTYYRATMQGTNLVFVVQQP